MPTSEQAEEHLRIIRSLMEKATLYRAVSAPGALIGGVAALIMAILGMVLGGAVGGALWGARGGVLGGGGEGFYVGWAIVLVLTALANLWLLRREALRRGEQFYSPGMRLALRAMLPALLGGGLSVLLGAGWVLTVALWTLFYGISLLAASHFAPPSIRWLGRVFFIAGAAIILFGASRAWQFENPQFLAYSLMGATFGLFHLVYAIWIWPRKGAL